MAPPQDARKVSAKRREASKPIRLLGLRTRVDLSSFLRQGGLGERPTPPTRHRKLLFAEVAEGEGFDGAAFGVVLNLVMRFECDVERVAESFPLFDG